MDWLKLHDAFKALMVEEDTHHQRFNSIHFQRSSLCALASYEQSNEFGRWGFSQVSTEHIKTNFELRATQAGIYLGASSGVLPMHYWLHRLLEYLRDANSSHATQHSNDGGGVIKRVIEASAVYCSHLQRKALENAVLTPYERNYRAIREALEEPLKIAQSGSIQEAVEARPTQGTAPLLAPRASGTITSRIAVERMDSYRNSKGLGLTEFASLAGTTDRTLRSFRSTSKARRDIVKGIAEAMGISLEELLRND